MASNAAGDATLVALKAVGPNWPRLGTFESDPQVSNTEAFGLRAGRYGAAVDDLMLDRLKLKVGDRFKLGDLEFDIRARIVSEPDRLGAGIGFTARALISTDALRASGLIQPGALIYWTTRVLMGSDQAPASEAELSAFLKEAKAKFPEAGWEVRSRGAVSPDVSRTLGQFGEFLALVGLISLVVGGVGVANAAGGFIERKRGSLAILKALGASGAEIVALALIEFLAVAAIGILIGLVVGAAVPYLVAGLAAASLPYPIAPSIYPRRTGARRGLWRADRARLLDRAARPGARSSGLGAVSRPHRTGENAPALALFRARAHRCRCVGRARRSSPVRKRPSRSPWSSRRRSGWSR